MKVAFEKRPKESKGACHAVTLEKNISMGKTTWRGLTWHVQDQWGSQCGQRREDEVWGVTGNRLCGVISIIRRTLERSFEQRSDTVWHSLKRNPCCGVEGTPLRLRLKHQHQWGGCRDKSRWHTTVVWSEVVVVRMVRSAGVSDRFWRRGNKICWLKGCRVWEKVRLQVQHQGQNQGRIESQFNTLHSGFNNF